MMTNNTIKVLVVDDHKLIREGIILCLSKIPFFSTINEAFDGIDAIEKAKEFEPDLVLLDIRMPKIDGIQTAKEIRKILPKTKIIMISGLKEEEYISESIKAGAKGYILKDSISKDLPTAIETVLNNGTYLDERVSRLLLNEYIRKLTPSDSYSDTRRNNNAIIEK